MKINNITGIILSGGKSSRMGQNKSLLKIRNITVIEHITNLMKSIFNDVCLITDAPKLYEFLNLKIHEDIYINVGPIAGIHSGLVNSNTENNFIISCDLPLMNDKMIKSIINHQSQNKITVTRADGFIQQLCGLYSKSIIPEIENIILSEINVEKNHSTQIHRKCKVYQLLKSVPTTIIENIENLQGYHKHIFLNMNTPQDYEFIKSNIESLQIY